MKITKTSSRTALRDIERLIAAGVMEQEEAGGRSTSYEVIRENNKLVVVSPAGKPIKEIVLPTL
jgi:predicted HTH transcriptional regulator